MYVCVCNVITDRQIQQAIEAGHDEPEAIYAACGVRPQCGSCAETMEEMIFAHKSARRFGGGIPATPLPAVAEPAE